MQRTITRTSITASLGLAVALGAALFAFGAALPASAAPDVEPVLIEGSSNKTCQELQGPGQSWIELKVDPPQNGTFSNGTLTVTISNLTTRRLSTGPLTSGWTRSS